MFRKKIPFGRIIPPFFCKSSESGRFSFIYMIRIRFFGPGELNQNYFRAAQYIFGDGSGTHSDPRIRRVGWSAVIIQGVTSCLGQTLECWKQHSERFMNSLKPTGSWMGTTVRANQTHCGQSGAHGMRGGS